MSRIVLVTGGSRGIGAAAARSFARRGWRAAVAYHRSEEQARALCRELGADALALPADVSDPEQARALVEQTLDAFGHLDALVCCAGVALPFTLVQDVTNEQWAEVFGVNVNGTFHAVRAVLPHMIHRKQGRIVTLSSIWGQIGGSCEAAYSATKGAIIAFTKAVAKEVGPSGITANTIAPGFIDTDMTAAIQGEDRAAFTEETALGRIGRPEEIAAAAFFLASDEASYLTGQVIGVNGGIV
jgi:3-oxoacyl-[acyl-carrier protein] reductase